MIIYYRVGSFGGWSLFDSFAAWPSLCGHPTLRKTLDRLDMSSTLFGRGTNTQVGGRKRAEDQEKAMASLRALYEELKVASTAVPDVKALTARIVSLESTIATLQSTVATLQSAIRTLQTTVPALQTTVNAVQTSLNSLQVTATVSAPAPV